MCEQVLAKADALEALDASISTLKYLREKKEDINLQIEAAVAFSGQHRVVAESEFATRTGTEWLHEESMTLQKMPFNLDCKRFTEKNSCKY